MSKVCEISGKKVASGNNVSHARNRTKRKFIPNLQEISLLSDLLGQKFKLRICMHSLRTVEHNGGFDSFLLSTPSSKLLPKVLKIKKLVEKHNLIKKEA